MLYSGIETSLPSMLDDLVKLACEQSDTDGSGRNIGISTFLAKLRAAHDAAVDAENMQDAKVKKLLLCSLHARGRLEN